MFWEPDEETRRICEGLREPTYTESFTPQTIAELRAEVAYLTSRLAQIEAKVEVLLFKEASNE